MKDMDGRNYLYGLDHADGDSSFYQGNQIYLAIPPRNGAGPRQAAKRMRSEISDVQDPKLKIDADQVTQEIQHQGNGTSFPLAPTAESTAWNERVGEQPPLAIKIQTETNPPRNFQKHGNGTSFPLAPTAESTAWNERVGEQPPLAIKIQTETNPPRNLQKHSNGSSSRQIPAADRAAQNENFGEQAPLVMKVQNKASPHQKIQKHGNGASPWQIPAADKAKQNERCGEQPPLVMNVQNKTGPPQEIQKRENVSTTSVENSKGKGRSDPQPPLSKRRKGTTQAEKETSQRNNDPCNLSHQAQSRHRKNDILAMVRAKLPGPCKLRENSIMLQLAGRIKELEAEINFEAELLECLSKLQTSNVMTGEELSKEFAIQDQNEVGSAHGGHGLIAEGQQANDGCSILQAVLPQPTKVKGTRLLALALEYTTELEEELERCKLLRPQCQA